MAVQAESPSGLPEGQASPERIMEIAVGIIGNLVCYGGADSKKEEEEEDKDKDASEQHDTPSINHTWISIATVVCEAFAAMEEPPLLCELARAIASGCRSTR